MDVFSHGLWAGAAYKAINKNLTKDNKKPLKAWLAALFGVFPDVFAFAPMFVWIFWNLIFGKLSFSDIPRPESTEPAPQDTLPIFRLASVLYNISHSVFIFFVVFGVIFLIFRRPVWELGGWFMHVVMDIPTHSYQFYPTPFLWPLSGWKFDGFSWGTPWFIIINYLAIITVYLLLFRKKKLNPAQSL